MSIIQILKNIYRILKYKLIAIWILIVTLQILPELIRMLMDSYEKGNSSEEAMKFGPLIFLLGGVFLAIEIIKPDFINNTKKKDKVTETVKAEKDAKQWDKYTTDKG